jgi:hypothetical protein
MKRATFRATFYVLFSLALGCSSQPAEHSAAALTATAHRQHTCKSPPPEVASVGADGIGRVGETLPIKYHGGAVMTAATNKIYYIWYGNWTGDTATSILDDLARNLGGSPYYAINSTYYSITGGTGAHVPVSTAIAFGGETYDPGSFGTALGSNVSTVVSNAISSGALPTDQNGIYIVLTAAGVTEDSFCLRNRCGYHSTVTVGGSTIRYAFVGHSTDCGNGCISGLPSPNQNVAADARPPSSLTRSARPSRIRMGIAGGSTTRAGRSATNASRSTVRNTRRATAASRTRTSARATTCSRRSGSRASTACAPTRSRPRRSPVRTA